MRQVAWYDTTMRQFLVEHHIQREIVRRLLLAESLRFTELKPDGMESNIFMYHMRQLAKNQVVEKVNGRYQLGVNGLRYADNISSQSFMPSRQPKLLSVVVIYSTQGDLLFARRHRQPFIGTLMFMSGKQHFGEDPKAHAERELVEKMELTGIDLRRRGLFDLRISLPGAGEPLTHIVAHVYSGVYDGLAPNPHSEYFSYEWHPPSYFKNKAEIFLPGTEKVYKLLRNNPDKLFFESFSAVFKPPDVQ